MSNVLLMLDTTRRSQGLKRRGNRFDLADSRFPNVPVCKFDQPVVINRSMCSDDAKGGRTPVALERVTDFVCKGWCWHILEHK